MTTTDLAARWEALKAERGTPIEESPVPVSPPRRYFRPLSDAADDFVRYAQSPHLQVFTGFTDIDKQMRGIAPGEVCMLIGYSHSGKTLTLMEILRANSHRHVVYFCPDEPRTLTLIKLACLVNNTNALDLEQRVREDDASAIALLRDTADVRFPHLAVIDDPLTIVDMEKATNEITDVWGADPDLVVFDYMELLSGGGEDVASKANTLKGWGRRHDVPLLLLHQTSRSAGADGRGITISSGAYGGETQATHVIGVRRKLFEINAQLRDIDERLRTPGREARNQERLMEDRDSLIHAQRLHRHTVTLNLVKNKRVGGALIEDGIDYEINHGTGRLTPLRNGDLPRQSQMEGF